jgi:uncharacterized protein YkwD
MRPRPHRGLLPFAALATALAVPGPAALAGTAPAPSGGTVIAAAGDALAGAGSRPASAPPAPVALATGMTRCAGADAQPSTLTPAAARATLLCAVNAARAASGLGALHADRRLRRAAGRHAHDMVRNHYFAHQRAGGPSLAQRLERAGWRGHGAGEAIAWGCGAPAGAGATVRAWLLSPPHRAIMLAGGFSRAGVGVARQAPAACGPGATWVLDAGG